MKQLVVSGVGINVYFSEKATYEGILAWIVKSLSETYSSVSDNNVFMLNDPISCGISSGLSYVEDEEIFCQFLIRGDDDYKIVDVRNIKPVL